jgi:succinyl-CoA synthetase beta subunit
LRLYEYEAKKIFSDNKIPVPPGAVIHTPAQLKAIVSKGREVVLKAQVLVGGRGKAGGILFAQTLNEAQAAAEKLLGMRIRELPVKRVLVEDKQHIRQELYLGITVDGSEGKVVVMCSSRGGMDIELIAERHPQEIVSERIDIRVGLTCYTAREMIRSIGVRGQEQHRITQILLDLYKVFRLYDAMTAEINPLVITNNADVMALDAKLDIDDEAIFRQPAIRSEDEFLNELEIQARQHNLKYVQLDGNIGVIGNGAGLNMTTIDILRHFDGHPANFLEVSGRTYMLADKGIEIVLDNPKVDVIFGNFFGCISRCDVIAQGLAKAMKEGKVAKPMVVSMRGNGAEEGRTILRELGIPVFENDRIAGEKACELAKRR